MTDEHTHRWVSATPLTRADGERIDNGDEFSPTDHELAVWSDRIEALDSDTGSSTSAAAVSTVQSGGLGGKDTDSGENDEE